MNPLLEPTDQLAFDYVTGVMRGEERKAFKAKCERSPELQRCVSFWEEELMAMSDLNEARPPQPDVWRNIAQQLHATPQTSVSAEKNSVASAWRWSLVGIAVSLVVFCLTVFLPIGQSSLPNSDYVAVLTNQQGSPLLTALTTKQTKTLWLKWDAVPIAADKNLQLWAVSRRDGQIRSLAVFTQTTTNTLALSDTHLHLIRDASYLLLTEEEAGGSPIDEPSETILAKGACVFLDKTNKTL